MSRSRQRWRREARDEYLVEPPWYEWFYIPIFILCCFGCCQLDMCQPEPHAIKTSRDQLRRP